MWVRLSTLTGNPMPNSEKTYLSRNSNRDRFHPSPFFLGGYSRDGISYSVVVLSSGTQCWKSFCPNPLWSYRPRCLHLWEEAVFLQGDATWCGDFGLSLCGLPNLDALRNRICSNGTPLCLEGLRGNLLPSRLFEEALEYFLNSSHTLLFKLLKALFGENVNAFPDGAVD